MGERGCRAQISGMWDTGVVRMGSSGLEEVMSSLVCTWAHSPASVALFAPIPVCSSERAARGVCHVSE